jgi:hypothetical protein
MCCGLLILVRGRCTWRGGRCRRAIVKLVFSLIYVCEDVKFGTERSAIPAQANTQLKGNPLIIIQPRDVLYVVSTSLIGIQCILSKLTP